MKTSDKIALFVIGVCVGWFLFLSVALITPDGRVKQCEQTLPRNQHCELVAVPVDKVEE